MSAGSVRAVWTDFGGVLTPPVAWTLRRFCAGIGVPVELFQQAMRDVASANGVRDAMAPLDIPLLDQRTWERQTEAALAVLGYPVDLSNFPRRWFADRARNTDWISRLHELRAGGVFVGLLSNMPPGWDSYWREFVPPEPLFDDVVLSFQVGCRKPEPEIFRIAAARAGVDPGRCLLVDDLGANCAGAREAGWQAIEFTDAGSAGAALDILLAPRSVSR